jgi:uncharacterized protein YegL
MDAKNQNVQHGLTLYENPQARCPVVLLLDVSGSMTGEPITELEKGILKFFQEVASDPFARLSVEVAVVTYGGRVTAPLTFLSCANGRLPDIPSLQAGGYTPMGEAIDVGRRLISWRRGHYRHSGISAYKPWMVLLTDGMPNDPWEKSAACAREEAETDQLVFFGVGVGPDADFEALTQILPAQNPPLKLKGLRFKPFFRWLSDSLRAVSRDSTESEVDLPSPNEWTANEGEDWNF